MRLRPRMDRRRRETLNLSATLGSSWSSTRWDLHAASQELTAVEQRRWQRQRQQAAAGGWSVSSSAAPPVQSGSAGSNHSNALLRTGSTNPAPHSPQSALRVARQQRHAFLLPSTTIAQSGGHLDSRRPLRVSAPSLDQSSQAENPTPTKTACRAVANPSQKVPPARCRLPINSGKHGNCQRGRRSTSQPPPLPAGRIASALFFFSCFYIV